MRVERLELIGFKSFAEKTVFNFHPGVTAIVGPNGCGKSNIVDAFRWVLGEQSAKSLRGDSMEDVIFQGSATKKTKGMAEVTLVLSDIVKNPSNGSEDDNKTVMSEIAVTRRLYRSGESEYLMNKVQCRLKDIKNVLLDTGLELKAYSILEQGKMDHILNSKPQDRRFLIEEIAGVMKYKVRRTEALNKLEASKSNLQRLQDIIVEVKRQINAVDRHARKAEKYKKLLEEIKDIELRIAKKDMEEMQNEISGLIMSEDAGKAREAEVFANLHSTEALIEEKKRLCVDNERHLNEVKMKLYSLEKQVAEDEGKIALLKSDSENLREKHGYLLKQDGELSLQKETAFNSVQEKETEISEMSGEITNLETVLEDKNRVFTDSDNGIKGLESDVEVQRRNLFNKAEEISSVKNEISHLSFSIENIFRKTQKSSQDINSLQDSIASLQTAIDDTRKEHLNVSAELNESRKIKEGLADRLREKKQELSAGEETLYREREDLAVMGSRLDSLRELDQIQRSSLDENIRAVCQVADIFETSSQYETAIEAILGDKLNAAVVEGRDMIEKALQYVREQKSKRSCFISVDTKNISALEPKNITGSGIIGEAIKFVTVRDGFQQIAASLLSNVVLVDKLNTAFSLRESDTDLGKYYFVTLEGEVLEPSGIVFGGRGREVLRIKRMIKEMEQDILAKKEMVLTAEENVSIHKRDIVSVENDIISTDAGISGQEKYCHALEVKTENLIEENDRIIKKHEYISLEINDDHAEKNNLENLLGIKNSELGKLESEKLEIEGKISSVQETIAGRREALETLRSELTEIKLNLTSTREKISSINREIGRLNHFIIDVEKKKEEMFDERFSIEKDIVEKEQEVAEKEGMMASKVVVISELQSEVSKVSEILEAKTAELAIIERQQRSLAAELESVRNELNHTEMKKMELTMRLNYLREDIRKTYSVEIETADITGVVTAEEVEDLVHLKERLQEIGPVSLGTLDEYAELKTRYDFLSKQSEDLLASIEALQDTIQKINRTTQARLNEAFNLLNEKFREVFTTLFGKGRAELHLTEGNILDAGIEIVAQPPGKRLQNLMLLSGGEKALTALSLLFAGFMIKPTPLCILDEVDAPLDESNTDRFINLLKELSKGIQFITITHNRRTMEAANYIYGITMEEPGSSKVVSMHFAETV
jgi:chromosome segregation protein